MSNKLILDSDILRGRIIDEEYGKKVHKLTAQEVRRIYIEETGKEPPLHIDVYNSDEILKDSPKDSGFDGTIIHFYDEKKHINEVYTIARGSENEEQIRGGSKRSPLDWLYNAFGIFVGKNSEQYREASTFSTIVHDKIEKKMKNSNFHLPDEKNIGLGHSLGGNLITTLQLVNNIFSEVHVINDAPPSAYQLMQIDASFRQAVEIHFKLNFNDKSISYYDIPRSELKTFAEKYYNDKGVTKNIHHLTAIQDILYALSGARGFIEVGERNLINTDPNYAGLRKAFDKIPDEKIQEIQNFLLKYAKGYNESGQNGVIKEATGINVDLIDSIMKNFKGDFEDFSFSQITDFKAMIADIKEKVPVLISNLNDLTKNLDGVLQAFVDENLMTKKQKEEIIQDLDSIRSDLNKIHDAAKLAIKPDNNLKELIEQLITIGNLVVTIVNLIFKKLPKDIEDGFSNITDKLNKSTTAHGISQLLNALNEDADVSYKGSDLMVTVQQDDGERIKVNLSSAVRIYRDGSVLYQQLQNELSKLINVYHDEFVEYYTKHRNKVMTKIAEIEQNPKSYGDFLPFSMNVFNERTIKSINVHEKFQPFDSVMFEDYEFDFQAIQKDITKGLASINEIKKSIEELFKGDKRIAMLIGGQ